MLFLSKLIQMFFYPVGLSIALAVAGGVFLVLQKKKTAIFLVFSSIGILSIFSCPVVAHAIVRSLESKYDPPADFPKVSAIVLLGGCTKSPVSPRRYTEPSCAGDRMVNAARLYRKGYAPVIVSTGGKITFMYDYSGSEAQNMADFLTETCRIDSSKILLEDKAKDTHGNATYTLELLREHGLNKDIILVTSAMHMYRSVKIFKKCGFTVYPAPADFREDKKVQKNIFAYFPNAEALSNSTDALHEYYGLIAYKIVGWL